LAIAKRLSKQGDLGFEITLFDNKARPDSIEQFLLCEELACTLNQSDQEVECTSTDVDGRIAFKQDMRGGP
jgi:hypothetical protein